LRKPEIRVISFRIRWIKTSLIWRHQGGIEKGPWDVMPQHRVSKDSPVRSFETLSKGAPSDRGAGFFWAERADAARARNKKAVNPLKTNSLAKPADFAPQ
jgi:hypothetical protein